MNEPEDNIQNEIEIDAEGPSGVRRRINPFIIVGAVALALGILIFSIWFFGFRDSRVGQPVPAPRTTTFGESPGTAIVSGQTVTVSPEQQRNSGIEIETVGEQLAAEVGLTAATGVIEPNAYRDTPALPVIGGIVRRVVPDLGDMVRSGQTVAVIYSNEFAETQSRYVSLLIEVENARRNFERTQRLVAINQPGRTEFDNAARQLKASDALLAEMQARHLRTSRLLAIGAASREEFEQDTTKLRTAEAEAAEALSRYERAAKLLEISPETRSQNEEALNRLRAMESELATIRQRLVLYGMSDQRIAGLRSASQIRSELEVPAPITGTVTSRTVNPGEVIEANKEILRVTDLSTVWVIAQAFERDLPRLRTGTGASITVDAYPERLFRGQVTYIDPTLDRATRTARVRVEIANPDRILKLGTYVNVAFGALGQSERTVPVVPASSVQNINGQHIVFLATNDPSLFELRSVRIGSEVNRRFPVLEGVQVGDRIVTNGSFMLRAEWLKLNQR
jgi:membrane fusion protein, heavy metal efflux system